MTMNKRSTTHSLTLHLSVTSSLNLDTKLVLICCWLTSSVSGMLQIIKSFWHNCQSFSWFTKVGLFVDMILLELTVVPSTAFLHKFVVIVGGICLVLVFQSKSTLSFKFFKLNVQVVMLYAGFKSFKVIWLRLAIFF